MGHKSRIRNRKEEKAKVIKANLEVWNKLSPSEKIKELDNRLGEGQGAVKQRKKLSALLVE